MKRRLILATAALGLALGGCATSSVPQRDLPTVARPDAVIATELSFARAAQEEGQWSAYRRFADNDAVMFVPQAVDARRWLDGRDDPAQSLSWQTHQVWSSCDGTLAVTRGAFQQPDGRSGYFTTVWERQRDGEYRWVVDHADFLPLPLDAPTMVSARNADCTPGVDRSAAARTWQANFDPDNIGAEGARANGGASADGTLQWGWATAPNGDRIVAVGIADGEGYNTVIRDNVSG